MSVFDVLKSLVRVHRDDEKAAAKALADVSAEFANVQREFSALEASFGARLVDAMTEGGAAKAQAIEAELETARRNLERLAHAKHAIASRLHAAQEAASAADLAKRWDAVEQALNERRAALVRFEEAVNAAGSALIAAQAAARAAWVALPEKSGEVPHYTMLAGEVPRLLAIATEGQAGGFRGSLLWDLKQQPGLIARADADARKWLRGRPQFVDQIPPPEAA